MIKKRNLDSSLIGWIAHQTGIGPGVGEVFHVAKTDSAYYQKLLDDGNVAEGNLFTLPSAALNAMTSARNDVMLVYPGAYAEVSAVAWNKHYVHALGMGGPRSINDYSEPGVAIYTTTANVVAPVNITGNFNQFHGITFDNNGAHTNNIAGLFLNAYGGWFSGCSFHGVMNSTQKADADCAALVLDGSAGSFVFEDCVIGDNQWTVKNIANQSQLRFTADSASYRTNNGRFVNCRLRMASETATTCLVYHATSSLDRIIEFNRCNFSNFSANWVNQITNVFLHDSSPQTSTIFLVDCVQHGFNYWNENGYEKQYQASAGVATVGGGICIEPTGTIQ